MSVGRNEPCPCSSGRKYKHCCGQEVRQETAPQPAAAPSIPDLLQRANLHLQTQQWAQAESCCQLVLTASPEHSEALSLLSRIALSLGNNGVAAELTARAIRSAPSPSDPLYVFQGIALASLGRQQEAEASLRQALALNPRNASANYRLGQLHEGRGDAEAAIAFYRQAAEIRPEEAGFWSQLGRLLLTNATRLDEAEAAIRQALTLLPQSVENLLNLGLVLRARGNLAEAAQHLLQARQLQPHSAAVLASLGMVLLPLGRVEEAIVCFREALAIDSGIPQAWYGLGAAVLLQGQVEEAAECQRRALALDPDNAAAHSALLMDMLYLPDSTPQALLDEAQRFAQRFEAPQKPRWPVHGNDRTPDRRLKVGYVSADLYDHVLSYFVEPLLAHHDKSRVEIFCYYNNTKSDLVSTRLQGLADHWRPCQGLSDNELAARIQADGIDILVDLAGHTSQNRLPVFARKPAPVQATWLGYMGTTGLEAMDYRLTDAALDPQGQTETHYSEALVRLPVWAVFGHPETPPVNALPALANGYLTLGCLNIPTKINAGVVRLWAGILKALPSARLLIGNAGEDAVRTRLLALFAEQGIGEQRLELVPRSSFADYLALHHRIDLALDPFPFTGGVTTYHSLWMGVPVLTLMGATTVSRQGGAILKDAGLPEFICQSEAEYLERAVALAGDLPGLNELRQSLRTRLNDGVGIGEFTRALEEAYATMWRTYCER